MTELRRNVRKPNRTWSPTYYVAPTASATDGILVAQFAEQWLSVTKGVRAGQPLQFTRLAEVVAERTARAQGKWQAAFPTCVDWLATQAGQIVDGVGACAVRTVCWRARR